MKLLIYSIRDQKSTGLSNPTVGLHENNLSLTFQIIKNIALDDRDHQKGIS